MRFSNNFQLELISQTTIVNYIEDGFEQELNKAKEFLDIEIKEKSLPKIAQNVDVREPIGEIIQY